MSESNVKPFDLLDVGGGMNDAVPPTKIGDNEWSRLENFYPNGTDFTRRDGVARVTTSAYTERLTSLFAYKTTLGAWTLVVGGLTGLARKDGVGFVAIPVGDGQIYPSETMPWIFRQYNDILLAVRRNTGSLKRANMDRVSDAGIAAPAVAATLADGGAGGVMVAGTYAIVYTFYNTTTGAESNPAPVSNSQVIVVNHKLTATGIGTSTNPQVDARRVYITLVDQTGEYYFFQTILDNSTTTLTINVVNSNLGSQASFSNGLPPPGTELLEIWKERAFVSDGKDVFFSEAGMPESFDAFAVIPVYPDDGHKIRALHAFGDRLAIGKTNAVHMLSGTDKSDFDVTTLSDRHGCIAPHSMRSAEGLLFWYSGENFYVSEGVTVRSISDEKVLGTLKTIPKAMKERVAAGIYPRLGWYVAAIASGDGATENNLVLVYNYRSRKWCTFRYPFNAPGFFGDFYDTYFEGLLYGVTSTENNILDFISGNTDLGANILAYADGKQFALGDQAKLKGVKGTAVLCDSVSYDMTMTLNLDQSVDYATRTFSLDTNKSWKNASLNNMGRLATTIQYKIAYSGLLPITVSALKFQVHTFDRMEQPA